MGRGRHLASGRVIALGRLLLATMLLAAIWADSSQPAQFPEVAYATLVAYTGLAALLAIFAWNNWWFDAHLAGPAHAIDIALFTIVVFLTEGDTSPHFIFCIFVLLAAAIRWGWRATALTAVLLVLLYFLAGSLTAASSPEFQYDRFAARTGYLVILSLILIWFGIHQWREHLPDPGEEPLHHPSDDTKSFEHSLRAAMAAAGSSFGALVWYRPDSGSTALAIRDGETSVTPLDGVAPGSAADAPFIYDLSNGRGLIRDAQDNLRVLAPAEHIDSRIASGLRLRAGMAVPVRTEGAQAQLYLEQIRGLSPDHLEFGSRISEAVAMQMQRQALIKAAEESAEARSRLAVARDLHDSVVQFLAGAAFRLEAIKRSNTSERDLEPELDELKQLMMQEQSELRSFITALRGGSQVDLTELAKDLQLLVNRLSRQWGVHCTFSVEPANVSIPARLHLDAQQLVREAVANAVRHAGAKNVSIRLVGQSDQVRLDFINDGAAYPKTGGGGDRMPLSLKERAEAAGGNLELSRGMGVTKVSVSLPVAGKAS